LNRLIPLLVVVTISLPGLAFSHAKITSTVPADGDFVASPEVLTLNFDNEVRLTGLELHSVEGVSAEGRTVEGEVIELGFVAAEVARSFMIEVPRLLPPGEYFLLWRCIATDSHFSTGEFFFTVVAN
jgi:methionine-rich copper-binding protein CopC